MHRFHLFNGDPHPGNYIFHADGRISFLDFGCVKFFESAFIADLQGLNRSIVEEDKTAFRNYVHKLGIVLPGRPFDEDFTWGFFAYHAAPFAKDEVFTFTPEYVGEAKNVMNPKDMRKLNLPPDLLFFNRITFGLNAIFQKLGASANFHQLYRRYTFPEENRDPAVALRRDDLRSEYRQAAPRPVTKGPLRAQAESVAPPP
jgi:predicted unusual protein kinase regulating ubiquinone biosynthesis (AarF/ABC1/UbiB family)